MKTIRTAGDRKQHHNPGEKHTRSQERRWETAITEATRKGRSQKVNTATATGKRKRNRNGACAKRASCAKNGEKENCAKNEKATAVETLGDEKTRRYSEGKIIRNPHSKGRPKNTIRRLDGVETPKKVGNHGTMWNERALAEKPARENEKSAQENLRLKRGALNGFSEHRNTNRLINRAT